MAQQTAVEWLANELHGFIHPEHGKDFLPILEQAKAMDKKQKIDAVIYGLDEDGHTGDWKISVAENYYKKTYTEM